MKSNVSYDYLKKIESKNGCYKQFSLDTIQKIANALEIDFRLLFEPIEKINTEIEKNYSFK